jgi:hypothetical protein
VKERKEERSGDGDEVRRKGGGRVGVKLRGKRR